MSKWDETIFNSHGVASAIIRLTPFGRPFGRATIPSENYDESVSRVVDNELPNDWLRRVANQTADPDKYINDTSINSNLLMIGFVEWDNGIIQKCSIQALVSLNGTITEVYKNEREVVSQYYRIDLSPLEPGPLFKEALPHIHSIPDGEPRFALPSSMEIYLPLRFIEFIFLNHFHDDWAVWAENVSLGGDITYAEIDEVIALRNSFNDGSLWAKRDSLKAIAMKMKSLLHAEKLSISSALPRIDTDAEIFSYHP